MIKILGKTLLWFLLIYTGVLGAVTLYDRWSMNIEDLDTYRDYPASIYASGNHMLTYGLDRIKMHEKQVLIIGASVSGYGYDLDSLKAHVPPGYHVHKLSMEGANISMYRQLIDDMEALGMLDKPEHLIIVFDGHFLKFIDDERKFKNSLTHFDNDKLRHKVFALDEAGKVVPRFSNPALENFVRYTAIKPFAMLYGKELTLHTVLAKLKERGIEKLNELTGRTIARARPTLEQYKEKRLKQFEGHGFG
ncbi:MAG: hypothetical protein LRY54_02580, partial [Alphaproteobacteria bacterium]|nr:hypothetical protein [Alphaproteobacteria bacterium]